MKRLLLSATGCLLLGLMAQTSCTPTWLSAAEDEQAHEVKAQFAGHAGRIKSLAVALPSRDQVATFHRKN